MTLQQQAYEMIEDLPEDGVRFIIEVIRRIQPGYKSMSWIGADSDLSERSCAKIRAFEQLEEMKKTMVFPKDFDPQRELEAALEEKYGHFD